MIKNARAWRIGGPIDAGRAPGASKFRAGQAMGIIPGGGPIRRRIVVRRKHTWRCTDWLLPGRPPEGPWEAPGVGRRFVHVGHKPSEPLRGTRALKADARCRRGKSELRRWLAPRRHPGCRLRQRRWRIYRRLMDEGRPRPRHDWNDVFWVRGGPVVSQDLAKGPAILTRRRTAGAIQVDRALLAGLLLQG